MKILYCIAGTYNSGGMERVLANKANYLARHGYEVVIATSDQRGQTPFFELDPAIRCVDLGINYEKNNGKSFLNKLLHYPFKQYRHRKRMSALLKKEQPDITISMYCNEASFLPSIKDGSKKVLEIHFSKFKRMQYGRKGLWRVVDWWRSRMDERLVRRYDKFVVLTKEDKGYWGDLPNIEVIPNARSFAPCQSSSLMHETALAIGRFTHQKGFDHLIKAWAIVHEKYPTWKLMIVGEGEERANMRRWINERKLQNNILLVKPNSNVSTFYLNASMYLLTSRYEGLPMVLLEAQAFGLPIIAYRCKCGPSDIVEHNTSGYLIENGDIKSFAEATINLIKHQSIRVHMGQVAKKASEMFDECHIMQQWINMFKSLCH